MARMAGDRGWGLLTGLGLFALVWACTKPDDTDAEPVDAVVAAMLADVWPEVVAPALAAAEIEAEALLVATEAWAAAERADGDTVTARAQAQEAWRAAMRAWQGVEVLQIGPAGDSLTAVGGADLRDHVYSWTTTNRCRVDQETVEAAWADADFFEVNLVNVYGLDAAETLLFSAPNVNDCPSQVDINASGTWAALGEDAVQQNRADYAVAVARQLVADIVRIEQAWDPAGGDFDGQLATAGQPGSVYESPEQAVNAVYDALFYLETSTKDRKLGGPLGLRDCGGADCLSLVETTFAGGSNEWVAVNLVAFRRLFAGGEGTGLEDVLRELGFADVADAVLLALDGADAAAAALEVPIDVAATGDPTDALALHAAIVEVTDLLKGDIATLLALEIPSEAAGDND